MFERGRREGTLRDDVPAEVLLDLFGGLLGAALRLCDERGVGIEEAAALGVDLFLEGARG